MEKDMKQNIVEFDLEKLKGKEVVVNCETREQANNFVKWVCSLGVDDESYSHWEDYMESTCYKLQDDLMWDMYDLDSCKYHGYKVISYEEALLKENKMEDKNKNSTESTEVKIKDEFIKKVKTEKIGVRINSKEELDIWYNFLDKHMDKSLDRYYRPFIKGDVYANYTYWNNIIEYNSDNGFFEGKGFTIYDFKDIVENKEDKFKEEPKETSEQKYLVQVKGKGKPKVRHTYENAIKEAKRLCKKEAPTEVYVMEVKKTFKSEVIITEVKEVKEIED